MSTFFIIFVLVYLKKLASQLRWRAAARAGGRLLYKKKKNRDGREINHKRKTKTKKYIRNFKSRMKKKRKREYRKREYRKEKDEKHKRRKARLF